MHDALTPAISRYVAAVRAAHTGQWHGQSATFWLSLGLDRGSVAHVAVVRDAFRSHGIDVSTSPGELGHEPPEARITLTAIPVPPDRGASITDLPDTLFSDVVEVDDHRTDIVVTDVRPAVTASVAQPAPDRTTQPPEPRREDATPPTARMSDDASSATGTWVRCPSCGATVLLSALFCPVCDLPRTYIQEQLHQRAAATGEAYPVLLDRVRWEGWPLPDRRQPVNVALRAWVAIGFLVLAAGARLDNRLAPVLVLAGMVVLCLAVFKPERLDAVIGHGASRRSRSVAGDVVLNLTIVMAFIVVTLLLWAGVAIVGMTQGTLLP